MSELRRQLIACAGKMSSGIVLPSGYTRLQYAIRNDNLAYIDTGVIPEFDDAIQIDVAANSQYSSWGSDNFVVHLGYWRIFMDSGVGEGATTSEKAWASYRYADGVFTEPLQYPSKSLVRGVEPCTVPMFLFRRYSGNDVRDRSILIAYYKDIKPDGSGCELYPAIRDADGVVGFYDILNDNFLEPIDGTLNAGPIYTGDPLYDEPE